MKHFASLLLLAIFLSFSSTSLQARCLTLDKISPVVVSSFPKAGMETVDADTTEIRVVFSKDMLTDNMWSVVEPVKGAFPEIIGEVRFLEDARTFVIPVKLEQNKLYVLSFNSPTHRSFRDTSGNSAQPYLLSFKTSG